MMTLDTIRESLRSTFVALDVFNLTMKSIDRRFAPVEKLIYGAVIMIVTAVFSALIMLVVRGKL
jgi:hypothetical protein